MNIDKSALRLGMWYEDEEGNKTPVGRDFKPPKGTVSYHTQSPLDITEDIYLYYSDDNTCKHPKEMVRRTFGWEVGYKGCRCDKCGSIKLGKKYIPFAFMQWQHRASETFHACSRTCHLSKDHEKYIVAMVNSGDYTLSEAIIIYATACERCQNALDYKYSGGTEGYPEDSDEYRNCNTSCDFCSKEQN